MHILDQDIVLILFITIAQTPVYLKKMLVGQTVLDIFENRPGMEKIVFRRNPIAKNEALVTTVKWL